MARAQLLADEMWSRYLSSMIRGHDDFQKVAKENEDYYMGRGLQWQEDVKKALESEGRPWLEENIIFSTINTILGHQTQSRMDIAFKPREAGDQQVSDILTKLAMFIVDQNQYPWVESQVFADGVIQQRGFLDIRVDFEKNAYGDIKIESLDPLDVIPDPDAKSYDPDDWADVMVTEWLTVEDLKVIYGPAKYRKVLAMLDSNDEPDFGSDGLGVERNKFGLPHTHSAYFKDPSGTEHVRLINRQWWKLQNRKFWFDLGSGDLTVIPDGTSDKEANDIAKANGWDIVSRLVKRVRWTVATKDVILHDEWSPYDHFTVVPYFPYFRRGQTRGIVDNLISTQDMINKTYSQMLHVVNTTANSGWILEEDSLANMETEDLEDVGGQTGLVLTHKQGKAAPEKIQPNQIPQGLKDMVTSGVDLIRLISGVSETFQGGGGPEVSGAAIQSRVQQGAIQLATPIDNLFRTRNILAQRLLKLIQGFYTEERTFLVVDPVGQDETAESVTVNEEDQDTGELINDVTVGKYDVVIADVPSQVTFQNAQFQQALDLRKFGIAVPDREMILLSTLARKTEIAKEMSNEPSPEEQQQLELQNQQLQAEVDKLLSEENKVQMEATKAAAEIAQLISENPAVGASLDAILASQQASKEAQLSTPTPEVAPVEGPVLGQI